MFDNLGTALIQLIGFFGVFGFFIYQLLSDNQNGKSFFTKTKKTQIQSKKEVPTKKGLFRRQEKSSDENITPKKGWFR